jgi:hypothetical protein
MSTRSEILLEVVPDVTLATVAAPASDSASADLVLGAGGRAATRSRRPSATVASSLALMLSTVGAGVLTFGFWTVIARTRGAAVLGAASAEIATITFLAGVGSLNMINVFVRFLPQAGHHARRFILISYAAALTAGLLAAVIFLSTSWSRRIVVGGTGGRIAFAFLVVGMSVFMIQDGGLVGFGKYLWVPVENITVGVGRLAALVLVVLVGGGAAALVGAWAAATVAAVLVINMLLIGRLAPTWRGRAVELPRTPVLVRFIAVESVTTAVASSLSAFLPAIVEHVRGAAAAGYFYLPWLITTTVSVLLMSVLISMVRALATTSEGAAQIVRGQLRIVAVVLAGVLVVCCVDPVLVMDILGSSFGHQAGTLLRWVGLSFPGTTVALLYWSFCLIDQRPWPIFAMNVGNAILVISGVVWLGRHSSIADIGMLYCGVQWLIAAAAIVPLVRRLRRALAAPQPAC